MQYMYSSGRKPGGPPKNTMDTHEVFKGMLLAFHKLLWYFTIPIASSTAERRTFSAPNYVYTYS